MKNILLIVLLIISTSSCGIFNHSSRNDNCDYDDTCMKRVKVEKDECEIQSEATNSGIRAYGVGVSVNPLEAREKAMLSAKIQIENQLKQTLLEQITVDNKKRTADFKEKHKLDTDTVYGETIVTMVNRETGIMTKTYVDNRPPKDKVLDLVNLDKAMNDLSDEIFMNASIICSNSYTVANNYEYHLCLQLAKKVYSDLILTKYDSNKKVDYDYDYDYAKFKETYDAEMEKLEKNQTK